MELRMKRIRLRRIKPSRIVLFVFLTAMAAFSLLPIVYVISTAFKPMDELLRFPPQFIVRRPTMSNFVDLSMALTSFSVPFSRYIFNSVVVTVTTVVGTVIISAMAAYALSKLKLVGGNIIFGIIVAALMFSSQVTQIPMYMLISSMGMINTYWALILPKLAVAYNVFLIKQFFDQVPDALIESAVIDGAGKLRIFWQIVMPVCKPAWTTVVVFSFVSYWNDYFGPLVFTNTDDMKTLTLAVQTIGSSLSRTGANAAATLLMIIPTVLVYVLMQRQVIETMIHSGIKG